MEEQSSAGKSLTFEQLADLREKTETIAQLLQKQLKAYLDTLRPLLAPRRLLGKYTGVKEDVSGSDRAFAQLQEQYKAVCANPFALPPELDAEPLSNIDTRLDLYPWEYTHQAQGERESKLLTITSPVRWVLTYSSEYTVSQVTQTLATREQRRSDAMRQFVVNALVVHAMLARFPGIAQLLTDLRYDIQTEKSRALGDLPLVTVRSCLPSFRPADNLMLTAVRFSGVPAFIELINLEALSALPDPLKLRIEQILL
jgi:hypothetical protein